MQLPCLPLSPPLFIPGLAPLTLSSIKLNRLFSELTDGYAMAPPTLLKDSAG